MFETWLQRRQLFVGQRDGAKKKALGEWGHEKRSVVSVVIDNTTARAAILILWLSAVTPQIRNGLANILMKVAPGDRFYPTRFTYLINPGPIYGCGVSISPLTSRGRSTRTRCQLMQAIDLSSPYPADILSRQFIRLLNEPIGASIWQKRLVLFKAAKHTQ